MTYLDAFRNFNHREKLVAAKAAWTVLFCLSLQSWSLLALTGIYCYLLVLSGIYLTKEIEISPSVFCPKSTAIIVQWLRKYETPPRYLCYVCMNWKLGRASCYQSCRVLCILSVLRTAYWRFHILGHCYPEPDSEWLKCLHYFYLINIIRMPKTVIIINIKINIHMCTFHMVMENCQFYSCRSSSILYW